MTAQTIDLNHPPMRVSLMVYVFTFLCIVFAIMAYWHSFGLPGFGA
ncbi:MAG TPA: hypothetical protein VNG90_00850 [Candidatus Acidoferrum sp.]|nr:hypothetical protein [Candidatus Acidoferrum sp.]